MKLSEKIASWDSPHPFYTFEFFPPRTDQGFENLLGRIGRLAALKPIANTVTWGAGGSTKDRSLDLAGLSQSEHGVDTVLHLTCTNLEPGILDNVLRSAKERGIQSILALRGDPPWGSDHWIPTDPRFTHAIDLVEYIRSSAEFKDQFSVGVAGYPDGHTDAETLEGDLQHLKEKVDAGADWIVTQLFYDVDGFIEWMNKVRNLGITVPIIPGIAPIQSYASFVRMTKLCGTRVPASVNEALDPIHSDDQKVKEYGVMLAIDICSRLTKEAGIKGVHFCTLNLEKTVRRVLEGLEWYHGHHPKENKIIIESSVDADAHLPSERLITASEASHLAERPSTPVEAEKEKIATESTNAAAWDDFPNGRFGDSTSPAFGALDSWVTSGLGVTPPQATALWGSPTTKADIRAIFLQHLAGTLPSTPFSPDPLFPESQTIVSHLTKLVEKGWWTVASQPAVDAASSSDKIVGWGPQGGYVFQKAFVECFCERSCVDWLQNKVKAMKGRGTVTYYAANAKGDLVTNVSEETRNAVTWGVFPGQEIAQPTIIERESFLAWKEDVFQMWSEWASFYPPASETRTLLEQVTNERWLVSVVHHDFKNPDSLWDFLLSEPSC
ncbi:MTHFR-domain-containing protein [Clavulina sp. PMI_390]|nr:MTHFR-domain-containing protein [Clavulina sp. PMI_390]